jgi:hypothetical protein
MTIPRDRNSKLTSHPTDPENDFVEALGRNFTAEEAANVAIKHIKDWRGPLKDKEKKWWEVGGE